ncbi:hypothetical protein [Xanthomonas arboricola]|uniref:hypothetical protein n=1 Tax=Xanthomonas arboricola TaxID=56448 RepID=UPI0011B09B97|nr:hypothetical protein [Xanthomonas arboricola]
MVDYATSFSSRGALAGCSWNNETSWVRGLEKPVKHRQRHKRLTIVLPYRGARFACLKQLPSASSDIIVRTQGLPMTGATGEGRGKEKPNFSAGNGQTPRLLWVHAQK